MFCHIKHSASGVSETQLVLSTRQQPLVCLEAPLPSGFLRQLIKLHLTWPLIREMRGWAEADAAGWKEPRDPLVQASLGLSTVTAGRDSLRGGGSQFLDWTHIAGAGGGSTWGQHYCVSAERVS